ncbi:MAG: hypothetical protein U1E16_04715 [Hyphomicrobiales bacterium]
MEHGQARCEDHRQRLRRPRHAPPDHRRIETRARAFGYEVIIGDPMKDLKPETVFAALLYPGSSGEVRDWRGVIAKPGAAGALATAATDLWRWRRWCRPANSVPTSRWGSAQRFGVPMARRPACGVLRHQGRIQACHAGPRHRRLGRCRGPTRTAHGAADARARTSSPREGDEQHLHRTGAACRHRAMFAIYNGPKGIRKMAERTTAWRRSSPPR